MQTAQARPHSPLLHDPVPIDAPAAVRTATAQKATLSLSPLSCLCCSRNEKESERWAASHGVAVPLLHYTTPHQLSHIDRMRAMRMRAGARFQQPWRRCSVFRIVCVSQAFFGSGVRALLKTALLLVLACSRGRG
jgi:hypothetical protein